MKMLTCACGAVIRGKTIEEAGHLNPSPEQLEQLKSMIRDE